MFHCILYSSLPCCMKGYETLHTQSDAAGCAPRSFFDLAGHTYFFLPRNQVHVHSFSLRMLYEVQKNYIYMYKSTSRIYKEKQNKLNNEFS